jgi:hypothetical protein
MNEEKIYSWGGRYASNIPPNYTDKEKQEKT